MKKVILLLLAFFIFSNFAFSEDEITKKSRLLASIYSLALPGLGEYYVTKDFDNSKFQILSEIAIWGSYIFFENEFQNWNDNSIVFGNQYSSTNLNSRNDDYLQLVGNYNNSDEYNQNVRNTARAYFLTGENPDLNGYNNYIIENQMVDENAWYWKSFDKRLKYREIREKSRSFVLYQKFSIGAIVVNHLISAINANRLARRSNRSLEFSVLPIEQGLILNLKTNF